MRRREYHPVGERGRPGMRTEEKDARKRRKGRGNVESKKKKKKKKE